MGEKASRGRIRQSGRALLQSASLNGGQVRLAAGRLCLRRGWMIKVSLMTQEERWKAKYDEIMAFMAQNHRRPSKYYAGERNNWNWMRHQQKLMGKGEMKAERMELFEKLLDLCGEYRRVNQYV